MKDINLQIQAVEQTPNKVTAKKSTTRYIIIKYLKTEDKILKIEKPFVIKNLIRLGRGELS